MTRRRLDTNGDWIIDMTLLASGAISIAFAVTIGLLAMVH